MFSVTKIVLLTLLLHFVADFTLQGWLAQSKCKEWWLKNAPNSKYKYDYICCLFCHAVYWTLVTYLPLIVFTIGSDMALCLALAINVIIHVIIDDAKANRKWINLVEDQLLHTLQIALTLFYFIAC